MLRLGYDLLLSTVHVSESNMVPENVANCLEDAAEYQFLKRVSLELQIENPFSSLF